MQELFDGQKLELNHVQAIVRGMYAVAKSDGVHDSELVLMREFYSGVRRDAGGIADFDDVVSGELDLADAKDVLDTPELRNIFITSCLFLAFADGSYTGPEQATIAKFAAGLGLSDDHLARLHEQVKDYLMLQVSRVENIDALKEIASEM